MRRIGLPDTVGGLIEIAYFPGHSLFIRETAVFAQTPPEGVTLAQLERAEITAIIRSSDIPRYLMTIFPFWLNTRTLYPQRGKGELFLNLTRD